MPHDPLEPQPDWIEELVRQRTAKLRDENAALRTLLVKLLRIVKEVEINLQQALDKDGNEDYVEDRRHV